MQKQRTEPDADMQKKIVEILDEMLKMDAAQLKVLLAEFRAAPDITDEMRSGMIGFAVMMLANELQERVQPDGLAIVMEADHFCMHWRGIKDDESMLSNSVMRGAFLKDASLRREFLSLLSKKT